MTVAVRATRTTARTIPAQQGLGITTCDAELPTTGWSVVHTADLDVLRGYPLRP